MPPAAAAPAEKDWKDTAYGLGRTLVMFFAAQTAMKYGMSYMGLGPQAKAPAPPVPMPGVTPAPNAPAGSMVARPAWDLGTPMSLFLYLSTAPSVSETDLSTPLLVWDGLTYGNWADAREADVVLDVPHSVRADNGSWYMDVLLVRGGGTQLAGKRQEDVASFRKELTRWMPQRKIRREKLLIGGDDEAEAEPVDAAPAIIAHWAHNLTLTVISDPGALNLAALQPAVAPFVKLAPSATDDKRYSPVIWPNDFWLVRENILSSPINATVETLPLHLAYTPMSSMKFNIFGALTASFEQAAQQQGTGAEFDEVKRVLVETNPVLLGVTLLVTLLHMVFEGLAFKNDIKSWKNKSSLTGVSLRTIIMNCVVQLIILLYLYDSAAETSFVILAGQGIGLFIEAWKITKIVDIRVRPAPESFLGYHITFEDKHELSELEKKTQEYDARAFVLGSYVVGPMLVAYAIYSLYWHTHRSWWSYLVTTAAQAVYAGGFISLLPQLYLNYRLKSVTHLDATTTVYKILSTVVDDFGAVIIKQPMISRLAAFRDDIVYAFLLYQRWIYPVDRTRVNEYGQVAEPAADVTDTAVKGNDGKSAESKKNK